MWGDFVAPAASDFLDGQKVTKEPPGDAAGANSVRHNGLPRPPVTGAPPEKFSKISGAHGQECLGAVPSGPTGALSLQNLELLRFHNCAWISEPSLPVRLSP